MLVTLNKVLRAAQHGKFAVGAFNVFNLETVQAVISAAEAMKSPVIVQTSEKAISYAGIKELAALIMIRAKESPMPIVFHLDHGRTLPLVFDCLNHGYTSVMYDGSHFGFDTNVKHTKEVVAKAHPKGISVEAELGTVGGVEDDVSAEEGLTDPAAAAEFVRLTHCDALAIGIGNNHGKARKDETLHLDVLGRIRQSVSTPLVLHGASSTPEAMIKEAIKLGITKINIDTDLRVSWSDAERDTLKKDKDVYDPRAILASGTQAVQETVMQKMALFGSVHKAKDIL